MAGSTKIPTFDSTVMMSDGSERLQEDITPAPKTNCVSDFPKKPTAIRKREHKPLVSDIDNDHGVKVCRNEAVITVSDSGFIARKFECRSVRAALELEIKLNSDHEFTVWWAFGGTARPPRLHMLE